ncbi:CBL-interacting protein kinase 29-like [Lolium perenne]|uniref:CBL-interacting protein kinase 29-like n=1 Tax=Lolium perenne TaxID=4522 RepID=UPI0021F50FF0|nr:CBL-interacting protein kinase 29-like [Lolium perenne]
MCGTPAYVSPEILSKQGYGPAKVDIWSCGVVLFVLAAGYLPFNDGSLINMYRKIYAGRFRCPNWFSPELRHLLRCILNPNPATRIGTDGIMDHPWFRHGADDADAELARVKSGHDEEAWFKTEFKEDVGRDMTAFDILAFSPGSDLSGLFGAGPGTERVFVGESAAAVLARVEDAGKKGGHIVRREGKKRAGPVYVEAESGIVAKVTVFKIADAVSLVEVVKGHGPEASAFWKDWLQPAVKPPAAAV